jgi:hypothetical protein
MDMTLRQIQLYYREAIRHEAAALADAITAHGIGSAASQSADGAKTARRTVDRLLREAKR